jgi:hypothetical protein
MNRRNFIKTSLAIPLFIFSNSFSYAAVEHKSSMQGLVESKDKWIVGNDELKDLDKNEGLGSTAWDRAKASYYSLKRRYKAARKAWSDN